MTQFILEMIQRHIKEGILLDTNLLLLYLVGRFNPNLIAKFKRTRTFSEEDFETLVRLLALFTTKLTTPNILTEVSNLAGQLEDRARAECFEVLAHEIQLLDERYVPSEDAAKHTAFRKFGLTDITIISLAKDKPLVLTEDLALCNYLLSQKVDAINFNNIRAINWKQ
jgi:hypothetical protein